MQRCGSEPRQVPWCYTPHPDLLPGENQEHLGCKTYFFHFSKQGHFKILIISNRPLKPARPLARTKPQEADRASGENSDV